MTARLLIGRRNPGEFACWLSRPAVNVFSAGDENLLISPSLSNLQFVANGVINLGALATLVVDYGLDLEAAPLVYPNIALAFGLDGKDLAMVPDYQSVPESRAYVSFRTAAGPSSASLLPARYDITAGTQTMSVRNLKNIPYPMRYMVLAIPQ